MAQQAGWRCSGATVQHLGSELVAGSKKKNQLRTFIIYFSPLQFDLMYDDYYLAVNNNFHVIIKRLLIDKIAVLIRTTESKRVDEPTFRLATHSHVVID